MGLNLAMANSKFEARDFSCFVVFKDVNSSVSVLESLDG